MTEIASRMLGVTGLRATIEDDRFVPGAFQLVVDGTPQSEVVVDDPTRLQFEYVERMGHVIDLLAPEGKAITAIHLGAGALTLPRYIEATRPGSRQQVLELERDLVDLVREVIPWSPKASIRVRYGDARETLAKLPAALQSSVDLLVVDVFSGARTPAHVTSREFYELVATFLAPDGVLLVNVADGPGLAFARAQAATLASVLPEAAALAEAQILKGRRFGNIVLVASRRELPLEWMPRLLAAGPHPAKMVAGAEFTRFIAGAKIVTDATSVPSPRPERTIFQQAPKP